MTRLLRNSAIALAWLAFGAIATIVIACTCALLADYRRAWSDTAWIADPRLSAGDAWMIGRIESFGAERVLIYRVRKNNFTAVTRPASEFVPAWSSVHRAVGIELDGRTFEPDTPYSGPVEEDGYGWPFRSMGAQWDTFGHLVNGVDLSSGGAQRAALPTRILPVGFVADAALAAGAGFLVVLGVKALRGFVRQRSGRCPHCGYRVEQLTSSACPECGGSIRRRRSDSPD